MAVENFGVSIGAKIAELLVEPVVHQFRYLFCFSNFVKDLEEQEKGLTQAQERVQHDVDAAKRNAENIEKDVQAWLEDASKATEDVKALLEMEKDKRCFINWCPNWIWQYRLGRRMAKKTINLVQLQENGKFHRVSYLVTPPCIEFLSKDFMPSKSSQLALKQIVEAIKDDNVGIIGLHGMGGVGKTTLVKEVGKQANELKLFDKVLMLVVSQAQDIIQIQDQLADKLPFNLQEKTKQGRADRIWQRLLTEKILIILDDVWKYLDLKDIGIPLGDDHKGCKILLTTRLKHVCISMGCQREIPLHVLKDDEAWTLFEKNSGVCNESSALTDVAMEVARECKGLPIAIVTVGRALRGKNLEGWKIASRKLKTSRLPEIRDVHKDDNAYTCLKLSFDYLQREETKLCFLMCSLFPEDYEISVENLVGYAVGLGLYDDAQSIEEARSEVFESIGDLKASGMLLETEKEEHVKMHDVVRDFALWFGSIMENGFKLKAGIGLEDQLRNENLKKYTAVSLIDSNMRELAEGLNCPKLELLLLGKQGKRFIREEGSLNVPSTCFTGMQKLKVLSLAHGLISMHSLESLINLQTLELKYCRTNCFTSRGSSIDLTSLQKLKSLKILNLHGSSIKELPEEIGELSNLGLLDLTYCQQLERIPPNTIQKLSKLEELYIGVSSFRKWEVEGTSSQTSNASLVELNSLLHLDVLWLYVTDDHIPKDFAFRILKRYRIQINYGFKNLNDLSIPRNLASRSINLKPVSASIVNVCKELVLNAYDLHLEKNDTCFQNIIPDIDQRGFNHLIHLGIALCSMECLISMKKQQVQPTAFSNLKVIKIDKSSLKEICDGEPPEEFLEKLQTLEMKEADGMITVFPMKLWRALQNLETVVFRRCKDVKEVFQLYGLAGEKKELLSRLMTLELENVPELRYIWKGPTHHVNLRSLTYLKLYCCDRLTSIFSPWLAQSLVHLETLVISHCQQLEHIIAEKDEEGRETFSGSHERPLSLQNLKTLEIFKCDRLEYVFPVSAAKDLLHLEKIRILGVAELKQFIGKGECSVSSRDEIENLLCQPEDCSPELTYFWSGSYSAVLPSLQLVQFYKCPKLLMDSLFKMSIPRKVLKASKRSVQVGVGNPKGIQLKELRLVECRELEYIIVNDNDNRDHVPLQCHFLSICFTNLVSIWISSCNKLNKLFPITIAQGLPLLTSFVLKAAYRLGEVFEGNDEAILVEKRIVVAKLMELQLDDLPSLISLCPRGYHLVVPSLETLIVKGCPQITTRFTVASDCSVHAKTEKPQIVEQAAVAIGSATAQKKASLRTVSEDIYWNRHEQRNTLPPYVEHEDKGKAVQVVQAIQ